MFFASLAGEVSYGFKNCHCERAGQICKRSSDWASLPAVICEIWSVAGDGIGATLVVVCYTWIARKNIPPECKEFVHAGSDIMRVLGLITVTQHTPPGGYILYSYIQY